MIEHVIPRRLLLRDLLDAVDSIPPNVLAERLATGLAAAVITRDDDRILAAAGVANDVPAGGDPAADPWCRYRHAGIEVTGYAPLSDNAPGEGVEYSPAPA